MEKLSRQAVDELLTNTPTPAVTIYIPMHTTASPPHLSENQIRFKNLLHKAVDQLKIQGGGLEFNQRLLALVDETHDDLAFWEQQTPGLLICATLERTAMFQLPIDTEEYVAVDDQFHLAPVLALLADDKEFYILALAQHNPHLFRGDMYGLAETEIELPTTLAEALNIDENNQKTENQGTATGPSSNGAAGSLGSGKGWFNGRGGARNPQEEDRLRYFRLIDSVLNAKADTSLPLILAGIEAEIAEYQNLSKYPQILRGTITGNHTTTGTSELFEMAMDIVRGELIAPEHKAALAEYDRLSGANPERVAEGAKLVTAAEQGRVDKLLASMYRSTSDTVRDTLSDVMRISFPDNATSKTLNKVASLVWQMRGKVISVLPNQIPHNAPMVARLRY